MAKALVPDLVILAVDGNRPPLNFVSASKLFGAEHPELSMGGPDSGTQSCAEVSSLTDVPAIHQELRSRSRGWGHSRKMLPGFQKTAR